MEQSNMSETKGDAGDHEILRVVQKLKIYNRV